MKKVLALLCLVIIFLVSACGQAETPTSESKTVPKKSEPMLDVEVPIEQGVEITIEARTGDCMPTIRPARNTCAVSPYSEIADFYLTSEPDLDIENLSNSIVFEGRIEGKRTIELKEGIYGVCVKVIDTDYCRSSITAPKFEVRKGEITKFTYLMNFATD